MSDHRTIASQLLAIVKSVHDGGRDIIGDRWSLHSKMSAFAERSDVAGMARYFDECLKSERGQRVARKLTSAGRKTLEDEAPQFLRIVAECVEESKLGYNRSTEASQPRLVAALDELLTRDRIEIAVNDRLQLRFRRLQTESRRRLAALPPLVLRRTPPELERAEHYMRRAAECYLLSLYEASAVLSRAALELVLRDRLHSRGGTRLGRTREDLQSLIARAAARAGGDPVITRDQQNAAEKIKEIGDRAAHGELATAESARHALVNLRRLVQALYL